MGRLVKNVMLKGWGAKEGPFGPISKKHDAEWGANDALVVRFQGKVNIGILEKLALQTTLEPKVRKCSFSTFHNICVAEESNNIK